MVQAAEQTTGSNISYTSRPISLNIRLALAAAVLWAEGPVRNVSLPADFIVSLMQAGRPWGSADWCSEPIKTAAAWSESARTGSRVQQQLERMQQQLRWPGLECRCAS